MKVLYKRIIVFSGLFWLLEVSYISFGGKWWVLPLAIVFIFLLIFLLFWAEYEDD